MKTPKPDIASPRPFWWGGVAALLAGFFFFLSCMLNLVLATGRAFPEQLSPLRVRGWTAQVPPGVLEKWRNLDPELLHRLWRYRALSADLDIGASALITLGFVALLASVVTLADAFEVHAGRAAHRATRTLFVPCFIFAAALAVLDLVFHAGAVTTAGFIYKYFEIDDTMLKNMEISYMLTQSREMWILGMLWWFFGVGLATAIYINVRHKMLSNMWNYLTGFIVSLCLIGFMSDIARLRWWAASTAIELSLLILVWFLFMPIWLVWVGLYLIKQPALPMETTTGTVQDHNYNGNSHAANGGGQQRGADAEMTMQI